MDPRQQGPPAAVRPATEEIILAIRGHLAQIRSHELGSLEHATRIGLKLVELRDRAPGTFVKMLEKCGIGTSTAYDYIKLTTLPPKVLAGCESIREGLSKAGELSKPHAQLCERCARVGPVKDCPKCATLSELSKDASKPSREPGDDTESEAAARAAEREQPKSGSVTFDWPGLERSFGIVARWPDQLRRVGQIDDQEHKSLLELLGKLARLMQSERKAMEKKGGE